MIYAGRLLWARTVAVITASVGCAVFAGATGAQSIIDEWSTVKTPPAPSLANVTLDRKTTALLLLDLNEQTCNQERRPRCIASIPRVKKLLTNAREAGVPVAFSVGGGGKASDINKELTRSLSVVDDARAEYSSSLPKISSNKETDGSDPVAASIGYQAEYTVAEQKDFMYWLKAGFAFTLPLFALGILIIVVLVAVFNK